MIDYSRAMVCLPCMPPMMGMNGIPSCGVWIFHGRSLLLHIVPHHVHYIQSISLHQGYCKVFLWMFLTSLHLLYQSIASPKHIFPLQFCRFDTWNNNKMKTQQLIFLKSSLGFHSLFCEMTLWIYFKNLMRKIDSFPLSSSYSDNYLWAFEAQEG